jgi:hypothetical protein
MVLVLAHGYQLRNARFDQQKIFKIFKNLKPKNSHARVLLILGDETRHGHKAAE